MKTYRIRSRHAVMYFRGWDNNAACVFTWNVNEACAYGGEHVAQNVVCVLNRVFDTDMFRIEEVIL